MIHAFIVIAEDVVKERLRYIGSLYDYQSWAFSSTCTPAYLHNHLKRSLKRSKVGIVKHPVGIDNAYQTYFVKIQPLADHLCPYQYVNFTFFKVINNSLVTVLSSRCI